MADYIERSDPIQITETYKLYQAQEGVPVLTGFAVDDVRTVKLSPWDRKGGDGAFINLEGTGGSNDAYICEIPPREQLKPQRHLYEEMVYVIEGYGSTSVWYKPDEQVSFEWQAGSLFAIPLNAWYQHFNGSGSKPARFLAVTNAPLIMNLFHNLDFVFNNPFVFEDRFGGEKTYFNEGGTLYKRRVLETNFVPDTHAITLYTYPERGAGGSHVSFELANNTMAAHISEFPVGTYKKAHRHGPGAHVIILDGQGNSLLWPEGTDPERVEWHQGSMVVPPDNWFHQHFNSGNKTARYLALRWNSKKFGLAGLLGTGEGTDQDINAGGSQIEYTDEDPAIHEQWERELAHNGAKCLMAGEHPRCTAH